MAVGYINSKEKAFIGFTGFAQSGKDEATKVLLDLGFERVSLADPVRQGIYNINPLVPVEYQTGLELGLFIKGKSLHSFPTLSIKNKDLPFLEILRLQYLVDKIGWDNAKKIPEVRRLLQYYGTEGAREIFGQSIWTDTADKYIENKNINKVAVSDVRFPNELEWIRSKPNNLVIKIKRSGVGPVNSHSSDVGIADELCDIIINNDGTIEELKEKLIDEMHRVR